MIPSPPETRASLILRLKDAADVAAWDEVAAIYGPLVFRMAQRQGLQAADADDVVQEVFAAVAKSVSDWVDQPQRGRFRHWLLGIARNISINVLTRRPHGSVGRGGDDEIDALAKATWDAFHLTHMEGVPIANAAKQLEISVGNVYIARSDAAVLGKIEALLLGLDSETPRVDDVTVLGEGNIEKRKGFSDYVPALEKGSNSRTFRLMVGVEREGERDLRQTLEQLEQKTRELSEQLRGPVPDPEEATSEVSGRAQALGTLDSTK